MPSESPREAFSYIAGYLDGEATIGYWCNKPEVKIDTCNPASLRFVSRHFGNEVKKMNKTNKNPNSRPYYRLHYTGVKAIKILTHTVEFMHEKKMQAERCIRMYELHQEMLSDKKKHH